MAPVDPPLAGFLKLTAGSPPLESMTPEQARALHRSGIPIFSPPERQRQVASVEDADLAGVPCRVYRPLGEGLHPTVVYLHGGGWMMGDLDTYDHTMRRIAVACDAVVVGVDYRLAPENPFPAGVEDCIGATRWVADHLTDFGGTDVLGVAGDSAGGSMTAIVGQAVRDAVSAQLLIYPATDLVGNYPSRAENSAGLGLDATTSGWFLSQYFSGERVDPKDPRVSPLQGDLQGLPRTLVVTAEFDPLRDEGEAYAAAALAAGNDVEVVREDGMIHGYFEFGAISPVADAKIEATLAAFHTMLR